MESVSLRSLLEAGCHFGHQVNRWNPKAKPFIFQARGGVHIIDLVKTKENLEKAVAFVENLGRQGGLLLMVGTKRQARGVVTQEAKRSGSAYLTQRWIGGFLTNWAEVKKNIDKLKTMRQEQESGAWDKFPKHERLKLSREMKKLEGYYGGVVHIKELPDAIFIVDIRKEKAAVLEAKRKGIPVVGIVDTNSNPSLISYPIPANDDAVGSIKLITVVLASAYAEGKAELEKEELKAKKQQEKKGADLKSEKKEGKRAFGEGEKIEKEKSVAKSASKSKLKASVQKSEIKRKKKSSTARKNKTVKEKKISTKRKTIQ